MMRVFVNGVAASAGGGLTYLRNVLPHLSAKEDVQTTVAIDPSSHDQIPHLPNISYLESPASYGAARRFLWEQFDLPTQIRSAKAGCLLSAGNFAVKNSPVPQVLLSGNSLYLSQDFRRDLRERWEYKTLAGHYARTYLAKRSIAWADCTVAPSQAFADDLHKWTGEKKIVAIHHGFDHEQFFHDQGPLPAEVQKKLDAFPDATRLLFVSHYNYYRNFETLFRALPILRDKLGRDVKLFLTCNFGPKKNPGSYQVQRAVELIQQLGIRESVIELGYIPNHLLHHVYSACHIYATASYAETFAHPLVEAMASGLPIVASNLPVHQEICGKAAVYFDCFLPEELAERISMIANNPEISQQMSDAGEKCSHDFSWNKHIEELLALMRSLADKS
jgi:glycosyltransferase involved in cell wall biosynthesis